MARFKRPGRRSVRLGLLVTSATFVVGLLLPSVPSSGRTPQSNKALDDNRPLREKELISRGLPLPDFDIRRDVSAQLRTAQRRAAVGLQERLGSGTSVRFGAGAGVAHLFRDDGYLTPGGKAGPSAVLRGFIRRNSTLFRLSSEDVATFRPALRDRDRRTGVTHLYLQQRILGRDVFGSLLKGHVDDAGRLISIEADYYPGTTFPTSGRIISARRALIAALRSSLPDLLTKVSPSQKPTRSSASAGGLRVAGGDATRFPVALQRESGADRLTVFGPGPFAAPIRVRQVIFPTATGSTLGWEVSVQAPSHQASYVLVVDAGTGRLLYRTNLVRFDSLSKASVFTKNPDATPLSIQDFFGDPALSPVGWSSGKATVGNNVQGDSATSTADFVFPFTDAWNTTGANPFDLAGLRLRFTPTDPGATSYTVTTGPAGSTAPGGTNLLPFFTNTDDGTINLICGGGWTGNILGATFTSFFVNTNGRQG